MTTEHNIEAFSFQTVTTICTENYPGYPDPLIYVVDVPIGASADEIKEAVIRERKAKVGGDLCENLTIHVAWPGDVSQQTYLFDHRT